MSFQPGDVVILKGSTHKMCVKQVQGNNKIGVIYFDGLLKLCEAQFSDVVLQYAENPLRGGAVGFGQATPVEPTPVVATSAAKSVDQPVGQRGKQS